MAGTFTDIVALADDNAFKTKIRVAMIKAAATILTTNSNSGQISMAQRIVDNPGNWVDQIALVTASVIPSISASAPVVPDDASILNAVTVVLPYLVR